MQEHHNGQGITPRRVITTDESQKLSQPKVCSACKAAMYCSQVCATQAWKVPKMANSQTHKDLCVDNKRHMLRVPEFEAVLAQFPWGRVEKDGSFNADIARGRYKVLGGKGFGFWSHRGGPLAHLPSGTMAEAAVSGGTHGRIAQQIAKFFDYVDGTPLLETKHLTDRAGWKLEPELIPFHTFSSLWEPPRLASKVTITDWDSWYSWRRLPKESPAALIMDFPMSVYWLLVHTLQVADPKAGSPDGPRVQLKVHYVGAETELNFLPLFAELALLLPYTDITVVFFGKAVQTIVSTAKESHPKSLAAQASPTTPIFSYTAPEESGAGRIQLFLHGTSDSWTPADADATLSAYGVPSALVAPNAGLGSYPSWFPVILYAHQMQLPFGVTEYTEQSCETQQLIFPRILESEVSMPGSIMRGIPGAPDAATTRRAASKNWEYPIEMNPFQRPGQRPVPTKLPNVPSGFAMRVVGK
ncbi:hypothetical protein FB45DRAFT_904826 [Roridomyces roridus]|uniref:Mitochondrial splicing suppressor 51-like C-terminal domain-containing protein n=1 Tax=Roridomyces roridus TaxID=1738132 RepID=A0AAD7C5F3_9AGAR|nr:hypothetical protein FB45DRAFT_904826 [Roridomyces roridus]